MRSFILSFAVALPLLAGGLHLLTSHAEADAGAEALAAIDAGPVAPDPAPVINAPGLSDPTVDPGQFAEDVQGAFRSGQWFMLVIVGMFGLARALLWAAVKWNVSWLTRWTPVLVTASGLLASVGATLGAGGTFDVRATLGALLAAAALYLSPAPKVKAV